jgi:hypothetical protein
MQCDVHMFLETNRFAPGVQIFWPDLHAIPKIEQHQSERQIKTMVTPSSSFWNLSTSALYCTPLQRPRVPAAWDPNCSISDWSQLGYEPS